MALTWSSGSSTAAPLRPVRGESFTKLVDWAVWAGAPPRPSFAELWAAACPSVARPLRAVNCMV